MISERLLKKWRKGALEVRKNFLHSDPIAIIEAEHIIAMTRELLDQHLLRERDSNTTK